MQVSPAYYDPSPWVDSDDSLIQEIEDWVRQPKSTARRMSPSNNSFMPNPALELRISFNDDVGKDLRLTLSIDQVGKINITLTPEDQLHKIIRAGHFKHPRAHTNPDKKRTIIPPPRHMHFPTEKYSILRVGYSHYAYRVDAGDDFYTALTEFCRLNNIEMGPLNFQWLWGNRGKEYYR